ncbi:class E sortase [Streptomyces phytohabitans]|uniref:class E sortase n=1 Tax=Streptomyces phytohabitans TaxID=1150371 RepID=UPI00345BABE2
MNHDRPEYDGTYGGPYSDPYGTEPRGDDAPRAPHAGGESGEPGESAYGGEPYGGGAYGSPAYGTGHGDPAAYGNGGGADAGSGSGYGDPDAYEAAVGALADPLTDPLPGGGTPGPAGGGQPPPVPYTPPAAQPLPPLAEPGGEGGHGAGGQPQEPAAAEPQRLEWGRTPPGGRGSAGPDAPVPEVAETAALPALDLPDAAGPPAGTGTGTGTGTPPGPVPGAGSGRRAAARAERPGARRARGGRAAGGELAADDAGSGRAARRRAAKGGGRARGGTRAAPRGGTRARKGPPPTPAPARAGTRLEARRAARAAKDGPVVILSRFIGEVFITLGVVMLLFVAYQLWWTNVLAHQKADRAANDLADRWSENPERRPDRFTAGEGFAIMYIPKLDIRVPVAEGTDKESVLDKGMVGHYDAKSGLDTAMPWEKRGNFSVAGHRNTHGEPFRYINKLVAGDEIIVETADTYFTYTMQSRLASTSPSNTTVVEPVPPQSGFEKPGRYITLTTCTPEFTSKFRLIVWGKMAEERPRSKGKPDALVG